MLELGTYQTITKKNSRKRKTIAEAVNYQTNNREHRQKCPRAKTRLATNAEDRITINIART